MSANGQAGDYPLMNWNNNCGTYVAPIWMTCPTCGVTYQFGSYHYCIIPSVIGLTWTTAPITPTQSGWACPKCSRIYGPTVTECAECNKPKHEQTPEVQAAIEKVLADLDRATKAFSEAVRNGARPPKG